MFCQACTVRQPLVTTAPSTGSPSTLTPRALRRLLEHGDVAAGEHVIAQTGHAGHRPEILVDAGGGRPVRRETGGHGLVAGIGQVDLDGDVVAVTAAGRRAGRWGRRAPRPAGRRHRRDHSGGRDRSVQLGAQAGGGIERHVDRQGAGGPPCAFTGDRHGGGARGDGEAQSAGEGNGDPTVDRQHIGDRAGVAVPLLGERHGPLGR